MRYKYILFCNLPYSFSILRPIESVLKERGYDYIWYVPENILDNFPFKESSFTIDLEAVKEYSPDVILVTGNSVPYSLRGVKVQIFHGLAGEKKGHFRVRDYFDLYLTQGNYFTEKFQQLSEKHKNFEVIETGWSKLDPLFQNSDKLRKKTLKKFNKSEIVLYAPTFSPSLTSAKELLPIVKSLKDRENTLIIIKFHDKMSSELIEAYRGLEDNSSLIISTDRDITPLLQIADLMISDTSSVVYEFLLLDKPVITLNSHSENILWANFKIADEVEKEVDKVLKGEDNYIEDRAKIRKLYHPYSDGKSSERVLDAIDSYIDRNGVPKNRELSLYRKWKIYREFGKV